MKLFLFIVIGLIDVVAANAQEAIYKKILMQMIEAKDGDTILLPSGFFEMPGSLSLEGKQKIVFKGAGLSETILSFKDQSTGAEGIKVTNCTKVQLSDFTVLNAKGDCIKTQKVNGIIFKNIKAGWLSPSVKNGGYAFYPVQCTNVLIDNCTATGASDAGIYVGQCEKIIVRNSKAYNNVAGIEIENSSYAEVYNNESFANSGGILVFDLPDLPVKSGKHTRVFNNKVYENNHKNFAPRGNIVAKIPPGTGVLLLAAKETEVFDNNIKNNRTVSVGVVSYYITENPIKDSAYDPFSHSVYIHDNTMTRRRERATMQGRMGKMYRFKLRFGKDVPHIIYDGITSENQKLPVFCLYNNAGTSFANIDAGNNFKNISHDQSPFECKGHTLEPAKFDF